MANEIKVFAGRLKNFTIQWKQGDGTPIDCTGATMSVLRCELPSPPIVTEIDETIGKYQLSFEPESTHGIKPGNFKKMSLALTMADAGSSPDPIGLTVAVQ